MHSSLIRILVSTGAAALTIVRATSLAPGPIPIPAPSGTPDTRVYAASRLTAHRPFIIDQCFTSGLDVNAPPSPREVALIRAASKQDWDAVLRMLDAGVPVESTDATGITPLMVAAKQGNIGILRTLLERHARGDFADLSGHSALYYAIKAGKLEAIQLLLPLESNLEVNSAAGTDLLTAAFETGDMKIFEAVLDRLPADAPMDGEHPARAGDRVAR